MRRPPCWMPSTRLFPPSLTNERQKISTQHTHNSIYPWPSNAPGTSTLDLLFTDSRQTVLVQVPADTWCRASGATCTEKWIKNGPGPTDTARPGFHVMSMSDDESHLPRTPCGIINSITYTRTICRLSEPLERTQFNFNSTREAKGELIPRYRSLVMPRRV